MISQIVLLEVVVGFLAGIAVTVYVIRRAIDAYQMYRAGKRMKVYGIQDLGPVGKESWGHQPKHSVCNRVLRIGRASDGMTFRYCALCEFVDEASQKGRLLHLKNHPKYKPKGFAATEVPPPPPSAA